MKQLIIHLPNNLAVELLSIYSRERKTYVHIKTCTWMITAVLSVIAEDGDNPKVEIAKDGNKPKQSFSE